MKFINWYTISLVIIACLAFFYSCIAIDLSDITIFIVMIVIVIVLEIIPIRLPSGDQYAAGSIGFLFLLIHSGFPYAVLAIYCATLAYYVKSLRRGKIPPIRLFVTIGMYVLSVFAALIVWKFSNELNVFLGVTLAALVFEVVNFVILEGLGATVFNKKMFTNIKPKLVEVVITAFISTIVISRLIIIKTDLDLIVSMIYTLFFLLILIYFSFEFTKQLSLRKSTSSAFIQVLEGRIAPNLAGHGNRVGIICDTILEDIGYPKKKRNDLVQAAVIHDIGKALIPSYIFRKRGNLTLSEEREYKSHPEKAVEFVKVMFPKETFSDWILYHHERWDGKGFPKGLKEEEIPLESRIIALANELDHIISRQKDPETILKIVKERSGTLLDPKLVAKVNLQHIEMMIEDIQSLLYPEELPQENQMTESQSSFNNPYSNLGDSFFIQMKYGEVVSTKVELPDEFLQSLSNAAIERQELVHETFMDNNVSLDLYVEPLQNGEVSIFAHDIAPYLDYRKKLEQSILESYIGIIQTLSNGKIKLHSIKSNLVNQLGEIISDIDINKNADVPKSRDLIKEILAQNPTEIESMRVQLAVTEAATNTLKHATGGNLSVYRINDRLQFLISDKGSGIPLHEIPKTILVSGYSSKRSLGQGFKMISSFSDGAQIYTSQKGTCILIEYKLRK